MSSSALVSLVGCGLENLSDEAREGCHLTIDQVQGSKPAPRVGLKTSAMTASGSLSRSQRLRGSCVRSWTYRLVTTRLCSLFVPICTSSIVDLKRLGGKMESISLWIEHVENARWLTSALCEDRSDGNG